MSIEVTELPEIHIKRSRGRIVAYAKEIRGHLVWVSVPERIQIEGLTFLGESWLQDLPHFLKRQAN